MTHHPENDPADTPEVRELFGVIASCYPSASGFSGVVVRSVNTKYATASDFFSGVGASKSGGRWNRKGLEATYTSLDIETAIKEAYQNLLHYGFPISNIRPRTTAGARVKLKKVLDILDAIDRSRLLLCRLRGPHRPIGPSPERHKPRHVPLEFHEIQRFGDTWQRRPQVSLVHYCRKKCLPPPIPSHILK
jgi:hypothetical protein